MSTFVLIHGAGDVGWYWHLVEAALRERGHDAVAPDLPCDDDTAGLPEYTDAVVEAIGERTDLVVVAQSLGGFTAPLVCERVPVKLLVLVAPMIPAPGEAPADYWANTRYEEEVQEQYEDDIALFYQDVPPELASEALKRSRRQSEARMGEPVGHIPRIGPETRSFFEFARPAPTRRPRLGIQTVHRARHLFREHSRGENDTCVICSRRGGRPCRFLPEATFFGPSTPSTSGGETSPRARWNPLARRDVLLE
jgi:pimeloyl-ACP methyl ester carboxylesterase